MIIAQISDTHISLPGQGPDSRYATAEHLARAVGHLNALPQRPDLVLLTGDLVDQGSAEEYRRLRELLAPLAIPLHLIPGNHDDRENLRAAFPDHAYLPATGFLHYVIEAGPIRLIGLDTHVPGEPTGLLCDARLAWLDARLAEARDRPTVLFMHHPPFVTGLGAMDAMGLEGSDGFARVVGGYDQVERILCGHLHRPIMRRFHGTVVCTSPATAHQIALDLGEPNRLALIMEPPACLLHVWSPVTGLVTHTSYIGDFGAPTVLR